MSVGADKSVLTRSEHPEDVFRTMADSAPVLLWMSSAADGRCTFFNQTWLEFTGRTLQQELGHRWAEGVHPEDFEQCMTTYMAAFRLRQRFEMIYRLRRHDGAYRWILDRGVPRLSESGAFEGYIGSCVDITEQKEHEESVRRSLREKELLLDEVLHRVKNNLQVVQSMLEMQARRLGDGPGRGALIDSRDRVRSMALIHQLVYHSERGEFVDFRRFLEALLAEFGNAFKAGERVAVHLEGSAMQLPVGTAVPCGLIVNELVSNAFKHAFVAGRGGNLWVSIERAGPGQAILAVSNDGADLPEETAGAGLGLTIVQLLAGQIGGKLAVQRTRPLRFAIEFPFL